MKVILEAVTGPALGRRIEITEGTILRIGRTDKSDCPLPEDGFLSSVHFAVGCDGQRCLVRDMGSSNGTFVNGSRIEEIEVTERDQVTAGGSTFSIRFEATAPAIERDLGKTMATRVFQVPRSTPSAPIPQPVGIPVAASPRDRWPGFNSPQAVLLSTLYRDREPLYALVDPVHDNRLPAFVAASGEQYCSLSEAQPDIELAQAMPLLVLLPPTARLLDVLIKDGWGKGWAVYIASHAPAEQVRNHLRDYLIVRTKSGKSLCLRFYDSRILRIFVERFSPKESAEFFGPITRIIAEDEQPGTAIEFKGTGRGVARHAVRLTEEFGTAPA